MNKPSTYKRFPHPPLPLPLKGLDRIANNMMQAAMPSIHTIRLAYRDPHLSATQFLINPAWRPTNHKVRKKKGWDVWEFQGTLNRHKVRVWAHIGGKLHGSIFAEFEVASVMGLKDNFIPVLSTQLADIPKRLARILKTFGIVDVAWQGAVTRLDLVTNFKVESEEQWDRYMDMLHDLKSYLELKNLYRGAENKCFEHPDLGRPDSVSGIGFQRKGGTLKTLTYRIDLKYFSDPVTAEKANLIAEFEMRLGANEIEAHMSPLCRDRTLPHVLGGLYFREAVRSHLNKLHLGHTVDPLSMSDSYLIETSKYRNIKPRLKMLQKECHKRSIASIKARPPMQYSPNKDGEYTILKQDIKRLDGLGAAPFTKHRQEAFNLFRAIDDAWSFFEIIRPNPIGTAIEISSIASSASHWDSIGKALIRGGPTAILRREICGMGISIYKANKHLTALSDALKADNRAKGLDDFGRPIEPEIPKIDPNAILEQLLPGIRAAEKALVKALSKHETNAGRSAGRREHRQTIEGSGDANKAITITHADCRLAANVLRLRHLFEPDSHLLLLIHWSNVHTWYLSEFSCWRRWQPEGLQRARAPPEEKSTLRVRSTAYVYKGKLWRIQGTFAR